MLNNEKVYGDDVVIVKHECVGHVQKRVVNRLQKLKSSFAPQLKEAKRLLAAARKTLSDKKKLLRVVQADQRSGPSQKGARPGRPCRRCQGRDSPSSPDRSVSFDQDFEADSDESGYEAPSSRSRRRGRGHSPGRRCPVNPYSPGQISEAEADAAMAVDVAQLEFDYAEAAEARVPHYTGRLSMPVMLKLQRYYGANIRRNVGNLVEMERDCWAAFYHSCSSDDDPQHDLCPTGSDTWCWYNRAVNEAALEGVEPVLRHDPSKYPLIPPDLAPSIKEVWEGLCSRDLLSRCVLGGSQNQNESFNGLIWGRCSKTDFSSPHSVQCAVYLAVLVFNEGNSALLPIIEKLGGAEPSPYCARVLDQADSSRLYRTLASHSETEKNKRRQAQRLGRIAYEEQLIRAEGVTYEYGGGD